MIYYYSPAAFRGKCMKCGTEINIAFPPFPLTIESTPKPEIVGDEGLVARIHELEQQLEVKRQ